MFCGFFFFFCGFLAQPPKHECCGLSGHFEHSTSNRTYCLGPMFTMVSLRFLALYWAKNFFKSPFNTHCFYKYNIMSDANPGSSFESLIYSKVFSSVCTSLPETDVGIRDNNTCNKQIHYFRNTEVLGLFQEHEIISLK